MFDGIDHVILVGPDSGPALRLYRDHLGFEEVGRARVDDLAASALWGLPPGPVEVVDLAKEGSAGGGIRLLEAATLPPAAAARTMHRPGPFAVDFYVRDLDALHRSLSAAGYRFRSAPQRYRLPGTGVDVREVLLEAPEGLVHALVQYLPGQHRCVLGTREDVAVSEAIAVATVVDDIDAGLALLRDVLRAEVYLDQPFSGPAIETLIGLAPGSSFRTVLLRGPRRRNARAELMATVPSRDPSTVDPPRTHPRLLLGCVVPDLDDLLAALPPQAGTVHGPVPLVDAVHGGARVATLRAPWGAFLQFSDIHRTEGI